MLNLEKALFDIEQDLLNAEEHLRWEDVLSVVSKIQALGDAIREEKETLSKKESPGGAEGANG